MRIAFKNKNHPYKPKTILIKRNQLNKNFKNNKLGFSKEKVNKIYLKLLKTKMNQKRK